MTKTATRPILVAEDDATTARVLRELLRPLGRIIHQAADGDAILGMVRDLRPSLLILDLNMPKRNGLDVLRALRRDPDMCALPVLVLSGQAQPETADRVREAGGDMFMRKPIDLEVVRELVSSMLPAA